MKYLIVLFLVLPAMKSNAQKYSSHLKDSIRGTILDINPNGDGFTKLRLPYGSTVKFKITNVNPFKISGTNTVSKESISFEVPAQFSQTLSQQTTSDFQTTTDTVLSNTSSDGDSQLFESVKSKLNQELKTTFINNYNGFVSTLYKLSLYTSVDEYIDSLLQETFIADTSTLKSNLKNYMIAINDGDTNSNSMRSKCLKSLDSLGIYYISAKGAYDELAKKVSDQKVFINNLGLKDPSAKVKFDSLNITFIREKIFEKEFKFLTAQFDTINSSIKRLAIINKTNHGVDYYMKVQNAKFEVYTDAQQLNDDKITITPKLINAKGDVLKEYSPVEIKTYGGWKVDVSTGYLLSFWGDANYTNLYKSTGISGVQKNKTDNLKHSLGALFNFYKRTGKDINFGPSIGLSIPTDGSGIGFYAGLSVLIMEKNRLVISIGIAENRIKKLNTGNLLRDMYAEELSDKETYTFSNADFREIKYDHVYRLAPFLGISYNIFTIKKAD